MMAAVDKVKYPAIRSGSVSLKLFLLLFRIAGDAGLDSTGFVAVNNAAVGGLVGGGSQFGHFGRGRFVAGLHRELRQCVRGRVFGQHFCAHAPAPIEVRMHSSVGLRPKGIISSAQALP